MRIIDTKETLHCVKASAAEKRISLESKVSMLRNKMAGFMCTVSVQSIRRHIICSEVK